MCKKFFQTIMVILLTVLLSCQNTVFAIGSAVKENNSNEALTNRYNTNRIIVKYKNNAKKDSIKQSVRFETGELFLTTEKELSNDSYEVVKVSNEENIDDVINTFNSFSDIEYAFPDYKMESYNYSNEELFPQQWALNNTTANGVDINVRQAWEYADGENVLVGVLDTGIDINNKELIQNIYTNSNEIAGNNIDDDNNGYIDDINGWNFIDDNSSVYSTEIDDNHGTNVAGIIAATANGEEIIGVSPKVTIVPLKFMNGNTGYTSDAIDAIKYAESIGVKIMNCSWGCSEYNFALKEVMEEANMLFVCAAGNDGSGGVSYPAAFSLNNVISVGTVDKEGKVVGFSSTGSEPDLYAPGKDIITIGCNNTTDIVSGTSFSAAHVTGVAALTSQSVPQITIQELRIAIKNGAIQKKNSSVNILDAYITIKNALPLNFIKNNEIFDNIHEHTDKLVTPEIAEILTKFTYWNELDEKQKNILISFFSLSNENISICENENIDILNSVLIIVATNQTGLNVYDGLILFRLENFNKNINAIKTLNDIILVSVEEKNSIISLIQEGYNFSDIIKALVVARSIDYPLSKVLKPLNSTYDFNNLSFSISEKEVFISVVNRYQLEETVIKEYLSNNSLQPSEFNAQILRWQEENNLYFVSNSVEAFSVSNSKQNELTNYNKYDIPYSGDWSYGNASINKASGELNYSQSIIGLAGRNNLNLELGLRFDADACDAVINAIDSALIDYEYTAIETRVYFADSIYSTVVNHSFDDPEQIEYWASLNNTINYYDSDNPSHYYISYTKIQATAVNSTELNSNNYYQSRYGLGIGWAFSLPSVEIIGTEKYLHLSGGSKYRILPDNSLDGYKLNDITFKSAVSSDFTFNGLSSAYLLEKIDGTQVFFTVDGRYLGSKDTLGNTIRVMYDENGLIDKIYDTANRVVDINYINDSNNDKIITISLCDSDLSSNVLLNKIRLTYCSTLNGIEINNYILSSISDTAGRTTSLDYSAYNSNIYFNQEIGVGTPCTVSNKAIYLTGVTSPTGSYTEYSYTTEQKAYGCSSVRDYKRVSQALQKPFKNNTNSNEYKNITTYHYQYDDYLWMYGTQMMWPLNSQTVENYSLSGDKREGTQYMTEFGEKKTTEYQHSTGQAINEIEIVSKDSYGQVTHLTQKNFNFDSANSLHDTSIYTLRDVEYTWDSNGYGQQLSYKVQSGDSNGLNAYYDEYVISTYNGISLTTPDTVTQYIIEKTNNDTEEEGIYQFGSKIVRTFDSETKKVVSESTSIYNLTTSERCRALSDSYYDYDNYGNAIRVSGTIYNDGIVKEDSSVTTNEYDQIVDISYSYDDTKGYHIYPIKTTMKNVRDADGNLLKNAVGVEVDDISAETAYNMFGQTISTTDGNGFVTRYVYNSTGDLLETINPDQTKLSYIYDYKNRIITITNPDQTSYMSKYDVFGNLTETYRLDGEGLGYSLVMSYTYDEFLRQSTETSYLDVNRDKYNITSYTYDSLGMVTDITVKNQDNRIISQTSTNYAQAIVNNGVISDSTTNSIATGETVNDVSTDNISTTYSDISGKTLSTKKYVDVGNVAEYTDIIDYSGYNTTTAVDGETVNSAEYFYNEQGDIDSTYYGENGTGSGGGRIEDATTYDGEGKVIAQSDKNTYYDLNGNEMKVSTKYFYDVLGRTIEVHSPFEMDEQGNIIYSKEKTYYDASGRVVETKKTNNSVGEEESYTVVRYKYDNMGRVILQEQVIDETSSEYTQYYYDGNGRLRRVYSQLSNPLTINGLDNIIIGDDANYSVVRYEYDFHGRLISYTDALDNTETYQYYDFTNQLYKTIKRDGSVTTYKYDNSGNVVQIEGEKTGEDTLRQIYTYDMVGNLITAKEINVTDDVVNSEISYTYDNMNRCLSESYSVNGTDYKKAYTYDSKHVTDFEIFKNDETLPSYEEHYKYDGDFLIEVTYDKERVTFCQYAYDNNGNLVDVRIGTHIDPDDPSKGDIVSETFYVYNYANLMTNYIKGIAGFMEMPEVYGFELTLDAYETYQYSLNGNLIKRSYEIDTYEDFQYIDGAWELVMNSTKVDYTEYTYDGLNRLTSELYGIYNGSTEVDQWEQQYAFNTDSNYTNGYKNTLTYIDYTNSKNNTITTNTYNKANQIESQLVKIYNGASVISDYDFQYDVSGNMLTKSENNQVSVEYEYDVFNRMSSTINSDDTTINYGYNALNQRVVKTSDNSSVVSVWNDNNIVVDYKTTDEKTVQNSYIGGNHGQILDGVLYANTVDAQGNVVATSKYALEEYVSYNRFDAYGNALGTASNLTPLAYRSQYYDSETGLYYLQSRYYDPTIQQFTQEDTYWGDGPNLFAYCRNNPVLASDPTGHSPSLTDAGNALLTMHDDILRMYHAEKKMIEAAIDMAKALITTIQGNTMMAEGFIMYYEIRIDISETPNATASMLLAWCAEIHVAFAVIDSGIAMSECGIAQYEQAYERYEIAQLEFNLAQQDFENASRRFDDAIAQLEKEAEQETTTKNTESSIDKTNPPTESIKTEVNIDLYNLLDSANGFSNMSDITALQIAGIIAKGVGLGDDANLFNRLDGTFEIVGYASIFIGAIINIGTGLNNKDSGDNIIIDTCVDAIFSFIPMILSGLTTTGVTFLCAAFPVLAPIAPFAKVIGGVVGLTSSMIIQIVEVNGVPLTEYIKSAFKKQN